MEPEQAEAEEIARAQGGCQASFRGLLERHGPPLFSALLRMCGGHRQDAEDLYQETLLKAARGLANYRHQGTFRAWLFRIARNLRLDQTRRRRLDEAPLAESLAHVPNPGAGLAARQLARVLAGAVDKLTPKLREVFLMRHFGELTHREIAGVLDLPLGTVLARMSYAMKILRPALEDWRRMREGEAV